MTPFLCLCSKHKVNLDALRLLLNDKRVDVTLTTLWMLEQPGIDVNVKSVRQQTLFHGLINYVWSNHRSWDPINVVKRLLQFPELKINEFGAHNKTPLHLACNYNEPHFQG